NPFAKMDRVEHVWHHDAQRGTGLRVLAVGPVLIGDAEVVRRSCRIAGSDGGSALGQRPRSAEIAIRHLLEGRAGTELHHHPLLAVPPPKARNALVVAVKDSCLDKG